MDMSIPTTLVHRHSHDPSDPGNISQRHYVHGLFAPYNLIFLGACLDSSCAWLSWRQTMVRRGHNCRWLTRGRVNWTESAFPRRLSRKSGENVDVNPWLGFCPERPAKGQPHVGDSSPSSIILTVGKVNRSAYPLPGATVIAMSLT